MKKALRLLPLFLSTVVSAQTSNSYRFQNSLSENAGGPALTELVSCGATASGYNQQLITTTEGQCGLGTQTVRSFNEGGGFAHPNGFVTGTYTVDIFFKFNSLGGYRRVIDFKEGTTDQGLYIHNSCLNFYSTGTSGTCPYFLANTYYLVTLVRDGATNRVDVYVNGSLFVNGYDDAAGLYAPSTTGTPIILFRDNNGSSAYQCEDSDGAVRYFSLRNSTSTAAEVAATYSNICAIALSQQGVDFSGRVQDGARMLQWRVAGNDKNAAGYDVQHSGDGQSWKTIATVPATDGAVYSYTDNRLATGSNHYRLRTVKHDGSVDYSNTVTLKVGEATKAWSVVANPASSTIEFLQRGTAVDAEISLYSMQGQRVWRESTNEGRISIPCTGLAAGTYIAVCRSAKGQEIIRVAVQH